MLNNEQEFIEKHITNETDEKFWGFINKDTKEFFLTIYETVNHENFKNNPDELATLVKMKWSGGYSNYEFLQNVINEFIKEEQQGIFHIMSSSIPLDPKDTDPVFKFENLLLMKDKL